jgi:hypothetical protein
MTLNGWLPVFRTGKHTDSGGNTREWTRDDLDKVAGDYNPSHHEAPLVIGHPKENAPAWGWVEALKREGDILLAKPKQLVDEFVEMLKKGMYKKRSISLYPDGSLRHIGFLGAMPPAVKGIPDLSFSDKYALTIEFSESRLLELRQDVIRLQKEEELIKKIARLTSDKMQKDRTLTFEKAFQIVVHENSDVLKGLQDIESHVIQQKIIQGGVETLLSILTNNKTKNEDISFSQAFTEVQLEFPQLAWEYASSLRQ